MSKVIGILGGMGPAATIDLFQKIVSNMEAKTDQEHLRIIIYNNPKIPPRKQSTNKSSISPVTELIESAIKLEQAGADFIIMPCHTAHIWYEEVKKVIKIPFYSMIKNTVQTITEQENYKNQEILLLATETTVNSRLYQNAFSTSPVKIVIPNLDEQEVVDNTIKDTKAGKIKENRYINELNELLRKYKAKGVGMLLGGCTEIPLIFPCLKIDMEMIDPTLLLAKMVIKKAT